MVLGYHIKNLHQVKQYLVPQNPQIKGREGNSPLILVHPFFINKWKVLSENADVAESRVDPLGIILAHNCVIR